MEKRKINNVRSWKLEYDLALKSFCYTTSDSRWLSDSIDSNIITLMITANDSCLFTAVKWLQI